MKCQLCGVEITKKNDGFPEIFPVEEHKRLMKLGKGQTVCNECKFLAMAVEIFSPFYA